MRQVGSQNRSSTRLAKHLTCEICVKPCRVGGRRWASSARARARYGLADGGVKYRSDVARPFEEKASGNFGLDHASQKQGGL